MQRLRALANQFLREYNLTIIGEDKTKVISDLRISFEVTKSKRSYPNIAKIDLYNPNEDTISLITNGKPIFILNAGYKDNLGLIFKGRQRNFFDNKVAPERVVTIYAGDGQREWEDSTINKTFSSTVDLKTLVTEILTTFLDTGELSLGTLQDLDGRPADKLFGISVSGSTKDVMDQIADDYGLTWSIQDNEITVTDRDKPLESLEAVLIKQTTGMVGSPTLTEIGADVTTLLNPNLLPNRTFKIESESTEIAIGSIQFRELKRTTAEGIYTAFEVLFRGDTHGAQWHSTGKGVLLNV